MPLDPTSVQDLRRYRNSKLYRPLARTLRVYNKHLVSEIRARGFPEFAPSFPQILSNVDTEGTRIGVLAARAGITRQAAGQLVAEIERCGFLHRRPAREDGRAVVVEFTARGRELLDAVLALVEEIEADFARSLGGPEFELLRTQLALLADTIDPEGAFGESDEPPRGE